MKRIELLMLATAVMPGSYSHSQTETKTSLSDSVLKEAYKNAFLTGVADNPANASGRDKASQGIVIKHFNSITVEKTMKAALTNPQLDVYSAGLAGDCVAFGEKTKCS